MKFLIFVSLLVAAVTASQDEEEFRSFKLTFKKSYKNPVEEAQRFATFKKNLKSIVKHNILYQNGAVTYKKGLNQFSDLTNEEFKAYLGTYIKPAFNHTQYANKGLKVPDSIDWRAQNQVTPVKNQGSCGSCWAFSIVGSVEAAYSRKSGNLVSLSEQQLIDCSFINKGCGGGYLDLTYPYIQENGLESETDYGYNGDDGNCNYDPSKVITKIDGYISLNGEDDLLETVGNIGPVSVAMDASYLGFYTSGIFSDPDCISTSHGLNHAVLVVGYGNENGSDFWIVKNSWGDSWGENGYFRIVRGTNECGIGVDDVYPYIN